MPLKILKYLINMIKDYLLDVFMVAIEIKNKHCIYSIL